MQFRMEYKILWNTGQVNAFCLASLILIFCTSHASAHPDFLDAMSRQFFGLLSGDENRQNSQETAPDAFSQMFGSQSQRSHSRPPPPPPNAHYERHRGGPPSRQQRQPNRQGHYPQPQVTHYKKPAVAAPYPPYNGPPAAYGQQQGFGQRQPESNETKTDGYPNDARRPLYQQHHPHVQHAYPAVEYQAHPHHAQPIEYQAHPHHAQPIEYHQPPATVVEYEQHHTKYHQETPPEEYHHLPPETVVVEEHQGPTLEIHTAGPGHDGHHYQEPEGHYHHPPKLEFEHHVEPKPKRFHISFDQNPDYKIVDQTLKLPPVKFRFHINPKIVITSNTKDPLDKKHHDDEHDLEPYPPPDVFSDHEAPPSYNKHTVEHYSPGHHYAVQHHEEKPHYPPVQYHEPKHAHYALEHNPHDFNYDLSKGHSHLNPHRSSGHYEPTFKIKTKPIIFTEPPPTRATTTTTIPPPTSSTARTTTTTTTTTARPFRSRARISARNPGFSVAFTQGSTDSGASSTTELTTSSTTTRRSIFRNNSERERENGNIARKDESASSSTEQSSSTSTTTTKAPVSSTTTTTKVPTTTTTTTKMPVATTTTTTTTPPPTTASTTTSTTRKPTTMSTTTTTTTTTQKPTTVAAFTPAEETTPRTTTLNADSNEIDVTKDREPSRRRPEPLKEESIVKRSETINIESSESVKVIETTMLIDGKNQTVRFYYITQPVKLPLDVFQHMTGQKKNNNKGISVIPI